MASTSTPGTLAYMAPEVRSLHQVSTKSDVYSFGVLLIELVSGKETFNVGGEDFELREFVKWVQNIDVQGQYKDIWHSILNKSIVDLNRNEAKKLMQISFKCIQVQNFSLH